MSTVPVVKSRKQNQPDILGKSLSLPFKPLSKHHTQRSRAGSSSGTKEEIISSPVLPQTTGWCLFSSLLHLPGNCSDLPALRLSRDSSTLHLPAKPLHWCQESALAARPRCRECWDGFVLELCCLPSETLNCRRANAYKSCKVGQQRGLRGAGVEKPAKAEGHDSASFAGKNQPPPGEEKYCKSLMKERQDLEAGRLPQPSFAGSCPLPFTLL